MADEDATQGPQDPALTAAMSALIAEIGKQPVPPRIRQLSDQLEQAMRETRLKPEDTSRD